jgi:hypothetical protein
MKMLYIFKYFVLTKTLFIRTEYVMVLLSPSTPLSRYLIAWCRALQKLIVGQQLKEAPLLSWNPKYRYHILRQSHSLFL